MVLGEVTLNFFLNGVVWKWKDIGDVFWWETTMLCIELGVKKYIVFELKRAKSPLYI